jgi:hypothetical protein
MPLRRLPGDLGLGLPLGRVGPRADFRLLSGNPKTYVKQADSGRTNLQVFCPDCASPIYSTTLGEGPAVFNIRLGTARQRDRLKPSEEYWCGSAQSWALAKGPTERKDGQ